jgi:hypothetical protein
MKTFQNIFRTKKQSSEEVAKKQEAVKKQEVVKK